MFITVTTHVGAKKRLVGVNHIVQVMEDARSDGAVIRIPDKAGGHLDLRIRESFVHIRTLMNNRNLLIH